jgi:phosphopantothenoylcysteine decarboxylase/phosphopantothenate--cysteine ligase
VAVLDPASGRLTGADSGPGRLPEPAEILAFAGVLLARGVPARDLVGRRVVVTAGGTHERLDPVRFLGNRSSGRQGLALARAAALRGADVTLIAANVSLPVPPGLALVCVRSAVEMREAVLATLAPSPPDALVMAAAVADFAPAHYQSTKIKKGSEDEPSSLALVRTPDILAEVCAAPPGRRPHVVVGFAAETHDVLLSGRAKLQAKGADLLVVNRVGDGAGFEVEVNAATLLGNDDSAREIAETTKDILAHEVWDDVAIRIG